MRARIREPIPDVIVAGLDRVERRAARRAAADATVAAAS